MTSELTPLRADPRRHRSETGTMIGCGAQLVHLTEQLHLRLLVVVLVLLGAAGVFSVPLAQADLHEHPHPLTFLFSALAILAAAGGLARRRQLYLWLRHDRARQLTPALIAAAIVFADGPYSPCWWIALALLLTVSLTSTAGPALFAGALTASAYAAGTLLRGAPLLPGGDSEYLTVIAGLLANPLITRALIESFARFTLGLHRLEQNARAASASQPVRVRATVADAVADGPTKAGRTADASTPSSTALPTRATATPGERSRHRASRLTARQLEVALLARDGLRQAEIAECLGISARQVERHLEQARRRVHAQTTAHLVAMLVAGALAPEQTG